MGYGSKHGEEGIRTGLDLTAVIATIDQNYGARNEDMNGDRMTRCGFEGCREVRSAFQKFCSSN